MSRPLRLPRRWSLLPILVACSMFATRPPAASAAVVPGSWAPIGGQAGAAFGSSVAPAGDVNGDGYSDVLVGAPGFDNGQADEGRAFLYLGSASGLAASPAWTWEPNQGGAGAGSVVSPAGDVNRDGYADILVGAPLWDEPGGADAGAVFVFFGSSTGPGAAPNVTLTNQVTGAQFGASVCTAGDVNGDQYADVIVGAPRFASGQALEGAVYVFLGSAGGLATVASFTLEGNEVNALMGAAVSTAGDVNGDSFADIIIGLPGSSPGAIPAAGKVYVLPGSVTGINGTPLTTFGGAVDSMALGTTVSLAGDVNGDGYADILLGSPGFNGGGARRGVLSVYPGSSTGVGVTTLLVVVGLVDNERMGSATTAGDVDGDGYADIIFGRERYPSVAGATGQALVYAGGKTALALQATLNGSDLGARFGSAVATAGDFDGDGFAEVLIGAPDFGTTGFEFEGKVFSYIGKAEGPTAAVNSPRVTGTPGTRFGESVAILPNPESDPFPAFLVGEPGFDAPVTNAGRATLWHTQWGSIKTSPARTFSATADDQLFGELVADAGDVDRDVWSDFLVSSPEFTTLGQPLSRGRVLLYRGSPSGPVLSPWVAEGDQVNETFGSAIAARGDVNGDGYHDVLVGAQYWDSPTLADCGKVWFYPGGPTGLGAATWTAEGTAADQQFGAAVAITGDLDADGYSDVAISSVPHATVLAGPARVAVYLGGPSGLPVSPAYSIVPSPTLTSFGSTVVGVGDVNGDGKGDLAIGAPNEFSGQGIMFLYSGTGGGAKLLGPVGTYRGGVGQQGIGRVIAGGGDLNGDGIADMVLGERSYSNGQTSEGRVLVFFGRRSPRGDMAPDSTIESNIVDAQLGGAIAPLADVNMDGFADIVAGATGAPERVFVYFGGGEGILHLGVQTESGFGGINRWSPAQLNNVALFGVGQDMRSAAGRDRVAGEAEVELQGTSFTGVANRDATSFVDTQAPQALWGSATSFSYSVAAPWTAVTERWRVRSRTRSPYFPHSRWIAPESRYTGEYDFRTGGTNVGMGDGPITGATRIARVAPNPATALSTVSFALAQRAEVRLDVYDVQGRHVRVLARGTFPAGSSTATWDGTDEFGRRVSAGIYFVEFRAGSTTDRGRIVRLP